MNYLTVLLSKHKKHLPKSLESTWLGSFLKFGFMIFISAWALQGIRIMNNKERTVKVAIDLLLWGLFVACGVHWIVSFVVAHTLNFMLNGQFHAMFTHMGATGCSARYFLRQTVAFKERIAAKRFIMASIAYGSLSRGCYKRTSDIDLRLIPAAGERNGWKCALYAVWLRAVAFCVRYPLDMYVYSPEVVVKRMRTDELPIMLHEREGCMKRWYAERVEFDEFVDIFTKENIDER